MAEEKKNPYEDVYKKITNVIPIDEHNDISDTYNSARIEGLGALKGKRVKDYHSGVELLVDAAVKFKKTANIPEGRNYDDKRDRHRYFNEIKSFLDNYQRQSQIDDDELEKRLKKKDTLRQILEAYMDTQERAEKSSLMNYRLETILPKSPKDITGLANYHFAQNPHLLKRYSQGKLQRIATDREALMREMVRHHTQSIDDLLNTYQPKDEKKQDAAAPKK